MCLEETETENVNEKEMIDKYNNKMGKEIPSDICFLYVLWTRISNSAMFDHFAAKNIQSNFPKPYSQI